MDNRIGLVRTEIRLVKKDQELVERVIKARDLLEEDREAVSEILRHNVWTINQFSDLTGLKESTISNKVRPKYKNGELTTELDFCYPFSDLEGLGPKFIVRNEKSERLLP